MSSVNALYTNKWRMPSFYKARRLFNLENWYELNPAEIFRIYKCLIPIEKYKRNINGLKKILSFVDKEVLLAGCEDKGSDCYGEYDNERKTIVIYCEEDKFSDFATIFFHELVHLMQYKNNEDLSDIARASKFDSKMSTVWLMERTADIAAKKMMKHTYPNLVVNDKILSGYTKVSQIKELYEYMDSYWIEEHNTKEGFFVDDLNITQS